MVVLGITVHADYLGAQEVPVPQRGEQVRLVTRENGEEILSGSFVSVDDSVLAIRQDGGESFIALGRIRRLEVARGTEDVRWVGLAIGAGAGCGAGIAIAEDSAPPVELCRQKFLPPTGASSSRPLIVSRYQRGGDAGSHE